MSQHTSPSVSPPVHAPVLPVAGSASLAASSAAGASSTPGLRPRHRRLARYLYAAPLVRIRRVLDIGGDAEGGALLSQHGARSVLVLQTGGEVAERGAPSPLKPGDGVTLRPVSRSELVRGGLRPQVGPGDFDVVFLRATPDLFTPAFLSELRSVVAKNGHLVVSARSREANEKLPASDVLGYFDLLDGLTQAGFGPVAMLGQSAFVGSALMPYGASEPPLIFDDTLAAPDGADEYVALCGAVPNGGLPYQIIKLPLQALDLPTLPSEKLVERVADPEVAAERDRLKTRLDVLRGEYDQAKAELIAAQKASRTLEERLHAVSTQAEAQRQDVAALRLKVDESQAAFRQAESQRGELSERLRQRDRSDAESAKAAGLHERQMRELRTQLDERDAYVAELEEQLRDLPRMHEKLVSAERLADEAQRRERQARQRLAEIEGQLLRARGELAQIAGDKQLSIELETRQREIEAARREVLMGRDAIEQAELTLAAQQNELARAQKALEAERAELGRLRSEKQAAERAVAERDAALSETRSELNVSQERLQQTHSALEQARVELQRQRERVSTPPLGDDGIPVLVGDLPTAPQSLTSQTTAHLPGHTRGRPDEVGELRQKVTELTAENERLKDKLSDAERETWKHMKARSEAEQAAAEVREDTVRKLRDARKLASVELTRAMEDATKKAVQLREELARTEIERKDAITQAKELRVERDALSAQLSTMKGEIDGLRRSGAMSPLSSASHEETSRLRMQLEHAQAAVLTERAARQAAQQGSDEAQVRATELRQAVGALETALAEAHGRMEREQRRSEGLEEELRLAREQASRVAGAAGGGASLQLQQDLQQRERMLAERTAERDALGRLLAEVEREAAARAERARTLRVRLSEREREVEVLRAELLDRDRKLTALEQQAPPSEELARQSSELQAARRRISELLDEAARRDQHGDDAVATALRERARAVRMGEALDQMTRERDEAKSRSSDLEGRLNDAISESERLHGELLRLSSLGSDSKL